MRKDGYWALFYETGVPAFYLSYRMDTAQELK